MARGFVYLVAVMDWFSRLVLSWRVSITMDADFCVAALREALDRHGRPEILNTDQGRAGGCVCRCPRRAGVDGWRTATWQGG